MRYNICGFGLVAVMLSGCAAHPVATTPTPVVAVPAVMSPAAPQEVALATHLLFSQNRSDLTSDNEASLDMHARYLSAHPQSRLMLVAYRPIRGGSGQNSIAHYRELGVKGYLVGHGALHKQIVLRIKRLLNSDQTLESGERLQDVVEFVYVKGAPR